MKVVTPTIGQSLLSKLHAEWRERRRRKRRRGISSRRIGSFDRHAGLRIGLALRQIQKSHSMSLLKSAAEISTLVKSLGSLRNDFTDIATDGEGDVLLGQTQSALLAAEKLLVRIGNELDRLCHQPTGILEDLHADATAAVDACLGLRSDLKPGHAMSLARLAVALGTVRDPNFVVDLTPIPITADIISSLTCDYEI